jgi:hypothetical protein
MGESAAALLLSRQEPRCRSALGGRRRRRISPTAVGRPKAPRTDFADDTIAVRTLVDGRVSTPAGHPRVIDVIAPGRRTEDIIDVGPADVTLFTDDGDPAVLYRDVARRSGG